MAAACVVAFASGAWAQAVPASTDDEEQLPVTVEARELKGRPDIETIAEGEVLLKRGPTSLEADRVEYTHADGIAKARGNVRVTRDGNIFTGPALQLQLDTYEGFFTEPTYFFSLTQAGGKAERIDFLGRQRLAAIRATYSSCTPDEEGDYAWLLTASKVTLDFENNEGTAEGGVLRFYGVPIFGMPYLTFPISDQRKSGWLPPSFGLDSKSGFELSVPYYWNIAPNYDLTLTPSIITKRGVALGTEFRYLQPGYQGELTLHVLPDDRVNGKTRHSTRVLHSGLLPGEGSYRLEAQRVSDDEYWKDFERNIPGVTDRLLPGDARANWWYDDWQLYARVQRWQVLQDVDSPIESPYSREPQLGVRRAHRFDSGVQLALEAEVNRFSQYDVGVLERKPDATRAHLLGSVSWSLIDTPGWFLTPRVSINAASYQIDRDDGPRNPSRVIPTLSVDNGWIFERPSEWFGRRYIQTFEPRLLYVNTPFREQEDIPAFDSAPKDFNFTSLFAPNPFSGVDRVADAHQLTAGAYMRFIDEARGTEALRLGLAQRYLFREQTITPEGVPSDKRFSNVLLLGSTNLIPNWSIGASTQYNPDIRRTARSSVSARFAPGPFRTIGASYSLVRNSSEQLDLGWQWPLYEADRSRQGACAGSLYSVGRLNYSLRDSRLTDTLLGLEYDAGCWIGRFVVDRRSTSQTEATTRFMFQIEFVGLSRLGSSPLRALRDNIPGYQLLREER